MNWLWVEKPKIIHTMQHLEFPRRDSTFSNTPYHAPSHVSTCNQFLHQKFIGPSTCISYMRQLIRPNTWLEWRACSDTMLELKHPTRNQLGNGWGWSGLRSYKLLCNSLWDSTFSNTIYIYIYISIYKSILMSVNNVIRLSISLV